MEGVKDLDVEVKATRANRTTRTTEAEAKECLSGSRSWSGHFEHPLPAFDSIRLDQAPQDTGLPLGKGSVSLYIM